MRLTKVRIKNFRQIPDLDFAVRRHLVIVGPNDSGKSALIRALNLLLATSASQLNASFSSRDFTDLSKPILIEAQLQEFNDLERAAFPDEIATMDRESLTILLEVASDPSDPELFEVRRSFPFSGHPKGPSFDQLNAIGWSFVPATRQLSRELGTGRRGIIRTLLEGVELADSLDDFSDVANEMSRLLNENEALASLKDDYLRSLSLALPEGITTTDLKLITSLDLQDDPLSDVGFGLVRGDAVTPLDQQSDGFRALSTIAAYNVAHASSNIVAIDEPETHLHPTSQRTIARLLATQANQVVIATHSSHVLSAFDIGDVLALNRRRQGKQLDLASEAARSEFATRWWRQELIEPLTAQGVIFVEGATERILVEAAAAALRVSLDRLGVTILELGGSGGQKHADQLLGASGFDIPISGLVDDAEVSDWATQLGVATVDLGTQGIVVCAPDLEGMYVDFLGVDRTLQLLMASGLFTKKRILKGCGESDFSSISSANLRAFCGGRKNKAAAVIAIGMGLTPFDAARLFPIFRLLLHVT
ncbi:MAG: ATP-dependent nuclease [Actinomycetota bacterium]